MKVIRFLFEEVENERNKDKSERDSVKISIYKATIKLLTIDIKNGRGIK